MLVVLVVLATPLASCNMMMSGGAQTPTPAATVEKPIDASAWPTPLPTVVEMSPTPFPKVTLAPTPTYTLAPTPTPIASAGSSPGTQGKLSFTGNPQELVQEVVRLSGGFTPSGAAMVISGAVDVRQGPGESYPSVGSAKMGEMAAVLGKNETGDWLYVLTQSAVQGWLPSSALRMTVSMGEPPVLSANPQAPATPESGLSQLLTTYAPVATGLVTVDGLSARNGPGSGFSAVGSVEKGELLGVFGINAGRDWVFIVTISGTLGWVPLDAVRIMGSL
jgi:uncharacterized protein YraI